MSAPCPNGTWSLTTLGLRTIWPVTSRLRRRLPFVTPTWSPTLRPSSLSVVAPSAISSEVRGARPSVNGGSTDPLTGAMPNRPSSTLPPPPINSTFDEARATAENPATSGLSDRRGSDRAATSSECGLPTLTSQVHPCSRGCDASWFSWPRTSVSRRFAEIPTTALSHILRRGTEPESGGGSRAIWIPRTVVGGSPERRTQRTNEDDSRATSFRLTPRPARPAARHATMRAQPPRMATRLVDPKRSTNQSAESPGSLQRTEADLSGSIVRTPRSTP